MAMTAWLAKFARPQSDMLADADRFVTGRTDLDEVLAVAFSQHDFQAPRRPKAVDALDDAVEHGAARFRHDRDLVGPDEEAGLAIGQSVRIEVEPAAGEVDAPAVDGDRDALTSAFFARFLLNLDLNGKRVADVGTGSGILALAAAQAGATSVLALDINPNAARAAVENAHANGFGSSIRAIGSNLLSAVAPRPLFDVILSSPPSFAGEPRDLADRAWHAGPNYRDILMLFAQARERLASDGCMYLLLSTDSDLGMLGNHIKRAGFAGRLVAEHSIFIESFLLYKLTVQSAGD